MRAQVLTLIACLALALSSASAFQAPTKTLPHPVSDVTPADSFCRWLNGQRARYRLGAVSVDPALNHTAFVNNQQQSSRGMGHHHRNGDRRQNVGWGGEYTVWNAWVASPPHSSALFDPGVTRIGYDYRGGYATYCGR